MLRPQRAQPLDRPRSTGLVSGILGYSAHRNAEDVMTTRREFLSVTVAGLAGSSLMPRSAGAAPKAMSVVHESSFIKAFDDFFVQKLAPEYEKMTGIKIN